MKPLIVANWKCNPLTLKEAKVLFASVKKGVRGSKNAEVVICPPFIYLAKIKSRVLRSGARREMRRSLSDHQKSEVKLGSQDCFWEENGAFTGEISPLMLKNLGVKYVIIGHSERRKHQRETNEIVKRKLEAALTVGLKVILCINKISQLPKNIGNRKLAIRNLLVAYEPLFAIGTGKPCTPEKAEKMRLAIKKKVNISALYGGSVNSQNAKDYIKKAAFQGLLVGGASLRAKEFIKIISNVNQA